MYSYVELMQQFYDDFPEAMGFVIFRNFGRFRYPDVKDVFFDEMEKTLIKKRNVSLPDYWGQSVVIGTNGDPAFTKSILGIFNRNGGCILRPVEQAFIFHHETYHALKYMESGYSGGSLRASHKEECEADAYATIRVFQEYGIDALPFMQFVSDWRIRHYRDIMHLTTFSVDNAISMSIGIMDAGIMSQYKARHIMQTAAQLVEMDIVQDAIKEDEINPKAHWLRPRTSMLALPRFYPEWLVQRHGIAKHNYRAFIIAGSQIDGACNDVGNNGRPQPA